MEDDADTREVLLAILDLNGFDAVGIEDGAEALAYLAGCSPPPRLVLLDMLLPGMDGIDFRHAQLADGRIADIPVVILSGTAKQLPLGPLRPAGFLQKPVDPTQLLAVVRQHCQGR